MSKEVFENVIRDRETFGISYCEVIRDMKGNVVQLEFIIDTPSIDMTYPLEPYIEAEFFYKGERMMRKKKFRKFRQNVAGRTVYFKEFGDPRIMDKRTGKYVTEEDMEPVDIDDQANEIIDFRLGSKQTAQTEVQNAIKTYFKTLVVDGDEDITVRVSSIGSLIASAESILDYVPASLKLNGSTENVKVGKESTPVLKEVLIDA